MGGQEYLNGIALSILCIDHVSHLMLTCSGLQRKILLKLDTVIGNQIELLAMQRRLATNSSAAAESSSMNDMDDLLERPCGTDDELIKLSQSLEDADHKKNMVNI